MKKSLFRVICVVLLLLVCAGSALAAPEMLVPGGCTVGIKLQMKGLLVTQVEEGSAAEAAGMKKGDIITQVNGQSAETAQFLKQSIDEHPVALMVLRGGKEAQFLVTPKQRKLGLHIRDSVAGIGTVTYYDPVTGDFGALGHGVNEASSGQPVPVEGGALIESSVVEVKKGKAGTPGELKGTFDLEKILGQVEQNCDHGIYGTMSNPLSRKPLPVAQTDEIRTGKATILSNVSGKDIQTYTVEILKLYPEAQESGRNMLLKVTDKDLLRATGGIVQGMSGSPILQNGKLVGAVTHVLVNDPTRGY